jgi:lambda family phage portal protein
MASNRSKLSRDLSFLKRGFSSLWKSRPSASTRAENLRQLKQAYFKHGLTAGISRSTEMYAPGADNGRLRGDWPTALKTATSIINSDFAYICARAELAIRTDSIAKRALQVLRTFTVGAGLKPFPAVVNPDGEAIESVNEILARDWDRFNDEGMRTGNERMTMTQAQSLELETIITYGSSLINTVRSRNGSMLPFAFQIVKPTCLDFTKDNYYGNSSEAMPASPILHGIARNSFMEPTGFHIIGEQVPRSAKNVSVHYYQSEAEQYLGLSWLTHVLPHIWDNQQLFQDKMYQSRALSRMGIWTKRRDAAAFDDLATEQDDDDYYAPFEQGMMIRTQEKPEAIQLDDKLSETFGELVKLTVMMIGIGLGFSYQLLSSDLEGMNFSSARTNKIADSRFFRTLYKWFYKTCCQHRWEKFVEWEVLAGRLPISLPDFEKNRWYYTQCFWLPEGEDWVDPLKDAKAMETLYQMGIVTLQQLCAMRGTNYLAILKQRRREKELIEQAGLTELLPNPNKNQNTSIIENGGQNTDEQ